MWQLSSGIGIIPKWLYFLSLLHEAWMDQKRRDQVKSPKQFTLKLWPDYKQACYDVMSQAAVTVPRIR